MPFRSLFKGKRGSESADPLADGQGQRTPSVPLSLASSVQSGSSETLPFPGGIKVWYEPEGATIDICFIHGLTGNRDSTWTAKPNPQSWPATLLPSRLPRARLLTWGYDAYVIRRSTVASTNRLIDHAKNLVLDLTNERSSTEASSRPLIFVAHSLGGLVCKEAILWSRNHTDPHQTGIFRSTNGIMFLGTPHRGSWIADWMKMPASALGVFKSTNKSLLQVLETNAEQVESIQERFLQMVRGLRESGRHFEITCFFEEQPLPVVGQVVPKDSATLEGFNIVSIHANHREMAKFKDADDSGFKRILGDLMRWEAQATPDVKGQPLLEVSGGHDNKTTQSVYQIPLHKNRHFVGRVSIIKELEDKLFAEKDYRRVAVVGLGGMGKTQLALQFADRVRETRTDYSIFWVPALSEAAIEKAYTDIAALLGVEKAQGEDDIRELVCRRLSSKEAGNWLLIVDNADDMELMVGSNDRPGLNQFLPDPDFGAILFTTRSREVAIAAADGDLIDLHELSHEEAISFLTKALHRKNLLQDEATTNELLQELTYLPLAISQAIAYLNQNQISLQKYLGLLRSEPNLISLMSREFHDSTRYQGSHNAIAKTWLISFDQIREADDGAASLLTFAACIEPKAIPQSLLPALETDEAMEHALGTLQGYGFFTKRGDSEIFDMHSLVRMATRLWLQQRGSIDEVTEKAIVHLDDVFSSDQTNQQTWRQYMPHALRLLQESSNISTEELYSLLFSVGCCLNENRRIKDAVRCLERVREWRTQTLPETDSLRLSTEHELAGAYLNDRRIKEAIDIFQRIVAIRQDSLDEGDPDRLASEHELARAYLEDRQIQKAIGMLERIVAVEKTILEDDDLVRLASEHELGSAYLDGRRAQEAIKILEHVVAVESKLLSEDDQSRLWSEHELARAYLENGRVREATDLYEHVVKIRQKTLAEEDHARLWSEHEVARAYLEAGRHEEATELYEHVTAIRQKTLVEEDHARLWSEHQLARVYLDDGRIEEARELLEHVVTIRQQVLEEDDEARLTSEHVLAEAYLESGRAEEAIGILEHVVEVEKGLFDEDDPAREASLELLSTAQEQFKAESNGA